MSSSPAYSATPGWHFDTSSTPPFLKPAPRSPLRQQIINESLQHARQHNWTKAPKFNGQATFDLRNGLRQVPFAKSKHSTAAGRDYAGSFSGSNSSPVSNFSYEWDSPPSEASSHPRQKDDIFGTNISDFNKGTQVKDVPSPISSSWSTVSFDEFVPRSSRDSTLDDHTQVSSLPSSHETAFIASGIPDGPNKRAGQGQPLASLSDSGSPRMKEPLPVCHDVRYNHTPFFSQTQSSQHDEVMKELDLIHNAAIEADAHKSRYIPDSQIDQSNEVRKAPTTGETEIIRVMSMNCEPISEDQLIKEVKDIYKGLVEVEKVCDNIMQHQPHSLTGVSKEERKALIALHRTLLHEHHDFFIAIQHPASSPALRTLATRFVMTERMWKHSTHTLTEMLRQSKLSKTEDLKQILFLQSMTLKSLKKNVPSMLHEWMEVEAKLKEYLHVLKDCGLDISQEEIEAMEIRQSHEISGSHHPSEYDRNHWSQDWTMPKDPHKHVEVLPKDAVTEHNKEQTLNEKTLFNLPNIALCLAGGWLLYGQVIADNFNFDTFCRVFKLIAYSGLQMTAEIGHFPY